MMGGNTACSTCSMNSTASACRSGSAELNSTNVIDVLTDLFILRGVPGHIRSDNGPEFVAKAVRNWIATVGAQTAYIAPGSPWENCYCESFNARLRDELLDGEILFAQGSPDRDRSLAVALQYDPTALRPGLPAASPRGRAVATLASLVNGRSGAHPNHGAAKQDELTFQPDHSMGADHSAQTSATSRGTSASVRPKARARFSP